MRKLIIIKKRIKVFHIIENKIRIKRNKIRIKRKEDMMIKDKDQLQELRKKDLQSIQILIKIYNNSNMDPIKRY